MKQTQQRYNFFLQGWFFATIFIALLGFVLIFMKKDSSIDVNVSDDVLDSLQQHALPGACLGDFTADGIVDTEDLSFFIKTTGTSPDSETPIYLTGDSLSLNLDIQDTNFWDQRDYVLFEQNYESSSLSGECIVFRI